MLAAAQPQQRLAVLEEGGQEIGEEVGDEAVLLLVTLSAEHGNPLCKMTLQCHSATGMIKKGGLYALGCVILFKGCRKVKNLEPMHVVRKGGPKVA